jgi:hypothetical protein
MITYSFESGVCCHPTYQILRNVNLLFEFMNKDKIKALSQVNFYFKIRK